MSGPHTRVRVDALAAPPAASAAAAAAQVSPGGKKKGLGRQMGLSSFFKGVCGC